MATRLRSGKGLRLKAAVESQQRLADYRAGNLQFTFSGWAPDYADVHTYAEPFGLSTGVAAKRVHYNNPQVAINNVNFGRITGASGSRAFQFGARFTF